MSKILKNQLGTTLLISDTGVTLPAAPASFTIPPQDYLLWAASSDAIIAIGSSDVIVNDGSFNLSISDGIDLIKGLFPSSIIGYAQIDDVGTSVSGAEDSYTSPRLTQFRSMHVNIRNVSGSYIDVSTASNQATEIASLQILDDVPAGMNAAFNKANPIAGQCDDVSTVSATENNVAPARITPYRALHVNMRDQSGNEFGTVNNPINTSGSLTIAPDLLAGRLFTVALEINAASSGLDNPLLLFRNPAGSGKIIYIYKIIVGISVTNVAAVFKVFGDAVITANGVSRTNYPLKRTLSSIPSSALVTSLPTLSSLGDPLIVIAQGQNSAPPLLVDQAQISLVAGANLVVTAIPNSNNRSVTVTLIWAEAAV